MARLPRFVLPGQPQHLIVRGNNRSEIFCADEDYRFYLDKLQQAAQKHGVSIHAYVLMTNHVHLLATPNDEHGLGKTMQMLGRYYVQYYNHSYQRTGTLWEGRYKATLLPVPTADELALMNNSSSRLRQGRYAVAGHPPAYPLRVTRASLPLLIRRRAVRGSTRSSPTALTTTPSRWIYHWAAACSAWPASSPDAVHNTKPSPTPASPAWTHQQPGKSRAA